MSDSPAAYTAFEGEKCIASGALADVARKVARRPQGAVLVFEDATGRQIDVDLRPASSAVEPATRPKGRGRPRLGVVAREVTLLPRHWEWLAAQPGGASAALRRLVDDARRRSSEIDRAREAQEAVYRVMSALAGDLPGFEDALRALYARDDARFDATVSGWPPEIGGYVAKLSATERALRRGVTS